MLDREYLENIKHGIQMQNVTVDGINISKSLEGELLDKYTENINSDIKINNGISLLCEDTIRAYLVGEGAITINGTSAIEFKVKISGDFIKSDELLSHDEFKNKTERIHFALLLPYLRSNLQILSALVNIPVINIPTLDVLKILKNNSN